MRKWLFILLAPLTVAVGVLLAWQWSGTRTAPTPGTGDEQQLNGARPATRPSRQQAAEPPSAPVRQARLLSAPGVTIPPPPTDLPATGDAGEQDDTAKPETDAPVVTAPPVAVAGRRADEELEDDDGPTVPREPSFRTTMKAAARQAREKLVEQSYGDLFGQLDLTDEELGRLKKMLLLAPHTSGRPPADPAPEEGVENAVRNAPTSAAAALQNALRSLLGQERYEVYRDYEATLPGRWLVKQYDSHLVSLGTPLTQDQEGQLLAIVVEERQDLPSVSAASAVQDLPGMVDKMAASLEAQRKSSAAILARAGALLDGQQLTGLRELEERRAEKQQRSLEAYRQLLNTGGQAVPSTQ